MAAAAEAADPMAAVVVGMADRVFQDGMAAA